MYKFRFVTTDLLAEMLHKDRSTLYESLHVLEQQAYVYKFYDTSYRIRGRPATYCLAAKGIRHLRDTTSLSHTTLRNYYKNKRVATDNQALVDHCLLVFRIANIFRSILGSNYHICTKNELDQTQLPKPLPDLYCFHDDPEQPEYLLDLIPAGTMSWLLRKRLRQHSYFADIADYQYPDVLLVAGNQSTETRLMRQMTDNNNDFTFYLTQLDLLLSKTNEKIWLNGNEYYEDEHIRIALP